MLGPPHSWPLAPIRALLLVAAATGCSSEAAPVEPGFGPGRPTTTVPQPRPAEPAVPRPVSLDGIAQLVVGNSFTCARLTDGSVHCWGFGAYGQLGRSGLDLSTAALRVPEISGAEAIYGGFDSVCARSGDGTVRCWGATESAIALAPAGIAPGTSGRVILVPPVRAPALDGSRSIA